MERELCWSLWPRVGCDTWGSAGRKGDGASTVYEVALNEDGECYSLCLYSACTVTSGLMI